MRVVRWDNIDIELLKYIYQTKDKRYITKFLNRKWKGIVSKANKLGLYHERSADSLNIEYFNSWSNNMAYVFGFIAADGCMIDSNDNIGFQIHLAKKDLDHLKNIKNELGYDGAIYLNNNSCKLSICSKYLYSKMKQLGLYPRKSIDLKFPYIPGEHLSHFVRGYFDGDGCIGNYFQKGKYKTWYSSFVGSNDFINRLRHILHDNCGIRLVNIKKITNKNAYTIHYSVKDTIKLGKWLYKDSTIYLERKHNKFLQLIRERKDKSGGLGYARTL